MQGKARRLVFAARASRSLGREGGRRRERGGGPPGGVVKGVGGGVDVRLLCLDGREESEIASGRESSL